MAEPARKPSNESIQPNIRPNLRVIEGGGESVPGRADLEPIDGDNGTAQELNDRESQGNQPFGVIEGGGESTPDRGDLQAVRDAEDNPSSSWADNTSSQPAAPARKGPGGSTAVKILKRGGPTAAILGILLSLASLVSFFGGPGLLIVQVAETITNKFDSQVASMDNRKIKILKAKLDLTTNGRCTGIITIRCKYSTFSKHDIESFKAAGIEVVGENKSVLGRTKATALKFTDPGSGRVTTVTAKEFSGAIKDDVLFRNATIKAYNTKFNSKRDARAYKSLTKSKTSYSDPFKESDNTDEARSKRVTDATKEGTTAGKQAHVTETADCNAACVAEKNKAIDAANSTIGTDAEKVAKENIKSAQPSGLKTVVSTANALGALDEVCTVPTLISAIGTGAKVIRAQQLIRYSMIFLSTASQIKAGKAKPEDVSYLGTTLTKIVKDNKGDLSKAATDSISYRYTAFGDKGSTDSSALFKVGGGLGGSLSGLASKMYSIVGGKKTCDTLGNPWLQGAGVLVSFIPGVGQAAKAGSLAMKAAMKVVVTAIVKNVVAAVAMNQIINYLTAIATDMVAGVVVDNNTFGEQSGDALVTGGAEFLTQTSGMGGNLPLTPDQAIAYNDEQQKTLATYDAYDRATLSPFDTSSSATFLGSISSKLVPYFARMTTVEGTVSALASINLGTFANLTRNSTAKAESADDYRQCEDYEYREINVATSPMCNIFRGIPAKYLEIDPGTLTDELIKSGDIDETTGDPKSTQYIDFVSECFSAEPVKDDSCLLTGPDADKRGKFAVHYVDQRNIDVMENGLPDPSKSAAVSGTAAAGSATAGTGGMIGDKGPDSQCAAWVGQYVLPTMYGIQNPGGDGWNMASNLGKFGYVVDKTPAVHAVVSWPMGGVPGSHANDGAGHVAVVYQVNADGSIDVEEHNVTVSMKYDTRHLDAAVARQLTYAHVEGKWKGP